MKTGAITPLAVGIVTLAGTLFVIDLWVPLGVAVWLPYVLLVLMSLWFPSRIYTYVTAGACTVLIVLGLFVPIGGDELFWLAAINRLLAIGALWTTAIVGLAARRTYQLEETNLRLQREIGERMRLQSQLLQSQRLESIGILASGIAHDFNNLLTPILMAVNLLAEDREEEDRQYLLSMLRASAVRGAEIVRQLLVFTGGGEIQRTVVQPAQIISEVRSILDHTMPKTISIHLELVNPLHAVLADATQLTQVLLNLCINARDAMPRGGVLSIRANDHVLIESGIHPNAKPGRFVLIEVADTGVGIPAQIIDKVFDPFFTTKEVGKGTGLGLSMVLGIVQNHGGFVCINSEVGKGSRISVYLPVHIESLNARESMDRQMPLPHGNGNGELILIVDDEPFIVETAKATLENHGYRVLTALNGRIAVDVFHQLHDQVQAVLLDVMMPEMDGETTLQALKKLNPVLPVIACSGLGANEGVKEAIANGQCEFLPKPYTEEQLLMTLAYLLRKRRGK